MRQAILVSLMASSVCLAEPVPLRSAGGAAGRARSVFQYLVTGRSADGLRDDALDRPAASLARDSVRSTASCIASWVCSRPTRRRCRKPDVTVWPTRTVYRFANEHVKLS